MKIRKIKMSIAAVAMSIISVFMSGASIYAQELNPASSAQSIENESVIVPEGWVVDEQGNYSNPETSEDMSLQNQSNMLSLEEYNQRYGHEELNHIEKMPRATLSGVKTQTKTIITSLSGINGGTVTIQYQTYMESGRPKFALDTVYLSVPLSRVGIWILTDTSVSYSSDSISVSYTYSSTIGGLTDYARVNFVPS